MTKFKKRKRLNVIAAVFVLTLFSGSAFAFTNLDPLVWNGRANIETSIRLLITGFDDVTGNPFNLETRVLPNPIPPHGAVPDPGTTQAGVKLVSLFDVVFTAPGQHMLWYFTVTNVGLMPARISEVNFAYGPHAHGTWFFNVPAELWGYHMEVQNLVNLVGNIPGEGMVLAPGESVDLEILVKWEPDFSLWPLLPPEAHEVLRDPNARTLEMWIMAELFYVPAIN